MTDRIAAVGGELAVESRLGEYEGSRERSGRRPAPARTPRQRCQSVALADETA